MNNKHLLGTLLAATVVLAAPGVAAAACRVTDYGAIPNDGRDDHLAVQAAIDACRITSDPVVDFPDGTWDIGRAGTAFYGLSVPTGVHLRGASQAGTVLRQLGGLGGSVRLLQVSGDDIFIERMTLDGNKGAQSPDEHRAGIFATATNRLIVRDVTARNFTGDGFTLYNAVNDSTFFQVTATGNDRDGFAMTPSTVPVDGLEIVNSRFLANRFQQVDSEGGVAVNNVRILGCTIDAQGVSNDYAVTVSGHATSIQSSGWSILDNTIVGGIFVVWSNRVHISGNTQVNPTTKPCVDVYRSSADVSITGNSCLMTQQTTNSVSGIQVIGTGVGSAPARVLIARNSIETRFPASFGVRAEGATSVDIVDNVLRGAGRAAAQTFYAGVYVRATIEDQDFRTAVVRGNRISNFAGRGVSIAGNGSAALLWLDVSNNVMFDDASPPVMTAGAWLDDGTGAAKQIVLTGNSCSGGVSTCVTHIPSGAIVLTP
jgi:Right handed beta helix region